VDPEAVRVEAELIEREVRAIIERALALGKGLIGPSVEAAFAAGVIDIPLAPASSNRGRTMSARDLSGAVRYYDVGNLPFDTDIIEFHRSRLAARKERFSDETGYRMILRDYSLKAFDSRVPVAVGGTALENERHP
jgi:methylaspartate mutase epsilon subunit